MYTQIEILLWLRYLLCCVYAGSSLEVKIETDSNDAMEIKTEADSNDITEYAHHDDPYAAMSGVSDVIFSTFICLCMTRIGMDGYWFSARYRIRISDA